jgi:hypothetical protein
MRELVYDDVADALDADARECPEERVNLPTTDLVMCAIEPAGTAGVLEFVADHPGATSREVKDGLGLACPNEKGEREDGLLWGIDNMLIVEGKMRLELVGHRNRRATSLSDDQYRVDPLPKVLARKPDLKLWYEDFMQSPPRGPESTQRPDVLMPS